MRTVNPKASAKPKATAKNTGSPETKATTKSKGKRNKEEEEEEEDMSSIQMREHPETESEKGRKWSHKGDEECIRARSRGEGTDTAQCALERLHRWRERRNQDRPKAANL